MSPPEPSPAWTAHDLLDSLPDSALAAIAEAGLAESPLLATELRQLGGAFADPPSPGGIVDRVGEPFLLQGLAIAPAPEVVRAAEEHYAVLRGALAERITTRC